MSKLIYLTLLLVLAGCSKSALLYHGRHYKIIQVGDKYWMAENLATYTYRNGRKIPLIKDYAIWTELYTPGCGYFENDTSMLRKYGMLYNWYAVETGKLCPRGWIVPGNDDWIKLQDFLGGHLRAAGKMKSLTGWKGKHISADDVGFNALPGGYRLDQDYILGWSALWWSSTPVDSVWVWGRRIDADSNELLNTMNHRQNGFSVRCVRIKGAR